MNQKLLIIDDDDALADLVKTYLSDFGYDVLTACHPDQGLQLLEECNPHLVILDVMLPDKNGFEVCKEIRKTSSLPIIILSARGEVMDRVVGLEIGADDYLSKPFEPRELVARIQSVLRRSHEETGSTTTLTFGDLSIDLNSYYVKRGEESIELTSAEFDLLKLFALNAGKVLNRDLIMESVAGIEWESENRTVDVLVSKLRSKLKDDPKHPTFLKTIRGSGYVLLDQEA